MFESWQCSEASVAAGWPELADTLLVELKQGRNAISSMRVQEEHFGSTPCYAREKYSILSYISRVFCSYCNETAGLLQPLKTLAVPNDLQQTGEAAAQGWVPLTEWGNCRTSMPLTLLFTLPLFVSTPWCFLFLHLTHIWPTCLCVHRHTSGFTGPISNSRLLSPSKAYQSLLSLVFALSLTHTHTHTPRHTLRFLKSRQLISVLSDDSSDYVAIIYMFVLAWGAICGLIEDHRNKYLIRICVCASRALTHTFLLHLSGASTVKSQCHKFLPFVRSCHWPGAWGGGRVRGCMCVLLYGGIFTCILSLCNSNMVCARACLSVGGGHIYQAQVSPSGMQTFCPSDPRTWPWRVGCQTITPAPQLVRYHLSLLAAATRPKATEDPRLWKCVCAEPQSLTMQQSLTLSEADLPQRVVGRYPNSRNPVSGITAGA